MTIEWSQFNSGTPVDLEDSDIVVGLRGGVNYQFLTASALFSSNNLSDVTTPLTAFNNISPLTTKGDIIYYTGTNNARLAIGSTGQILIISGGDPSWANNPGLLIANNLSDLNSVSSALTNLGLSSSSTVAFGLTSATSSTASATPGTIRALIGSMTSSNTTITSGNLVGVRGVVNMVGSSTSAYVYGIQGKIIATGTLASGQFQAGVFGQADFSTSTINSGQFAPLWGDYGTSINSVTSNTGLYGVAMTNSTGAKIYAQDYRYGDADFWQSLQSVTTFFVSAGTSSGSAGYISGCNASEVLIINVNGSTYYVPAFAQNT